MTFGRFKSLDSSSIQSSTIIPQSFSWNILLSDVITWNFSNEIFYLRSSVCDAKARWQPIVTFMTNISRLLMIQHIEIFSLQKLEWNECSSSLSSSYTLSTSKSSSALHFVMILSSFCHHSVISFPFRWHYFVISLSSFCYHFIIIVIILSSLCYLFDITLSSFFQHRVIIMSWFCHQSEWADG